MKRSTTTVIAIAAVLASSLIGSVAHAQSSYFQGLSLGLGSKWANTTSENALGGASFSTSNTDNNAVWQLQYNAAVGDSFLLGVGATADWGNLNAGSIGPFHYTLRDAYSVYVAPGLAFNDSWMGYVKLAYLNANLQRSPGYTQNFGNGFGYGLGVQAMFGRNWFGQFEYMFNTYPDRNPNPGETLKLKSEGPSLTLGYKF